MGYKEKYFTFGLFVKFGPILLIFEKCHFLVGLSLHFKKILKDISLFVMPLIPLFWTSGDVSSGVQSQRAFKALFTLGGGICDIHSLRFTSGVTPADLLVARMAASLLPSCVYQQR